MGLLGEIFGIVFENVKGKVSDYQKNFDESYYSSSECYENMSDERLSREIQRLKNMSGYDAKRMGRIAAMKAELDSRRD